MIAATTMMMQMMMTMTILLLLTTKNDVRVGVDASLVNCVVTLPEEGETAIAYQSCYDFEVDAPGSDALYCRSKQDCETVLLYFGSSSTATQVVEVDYAAWIPVLNEEDNSYTVGNEEAFIVFKEESATFGSSTTSSTSGEEIGFSNFTLEGIVEETETKGVLFSPNTGGSITWTADGTVVIVSIVDPNTEIIDPTTTTTINIPIVYNYTDDMFTIAGSIDGCADFVLGFTADDIYVECMSVDGSGEDNEAEILNDGVAPPTTSNADGSNTTDTTDADTDADADADEVGEDVNVDVDVDAEEEEEGEQLEQEYPESNFVSDDEESFVIIEEVVDGNTTDTTSTTSNNDTTTTTTAVVVVLEEEGTTTRNDNEDEEGEDEEAPIPSPTPTNVLPVVVPETLAPTTTTMVVVTEEEVVMQQEEQEEKEEQPPGEVDELDVVVADPAAADPAILLEENASAASSSSSSSSTTLITTSTILRTTTTTMTTAAVVLVVVVLTTTMMIAMM